MILTNVQPLIENVMKTSEETIALRKERNMAINAKFTEYLKQGLGFMEAYEKTARDFWLSERHIRDIIAGRK